MTYVLLADGEPVTTYLSGPRVVPVEYETVAQASREAKRELLRWLDRQDEGARTTFGFVRLPAPVYEVAIAKYEVVKTIRVEDVE